jgi:hypothetical protein
VKNDGEIIAGKGGAMQRKTAAPGTRRVQQEVMSHPPKSFSFSYSFTKHPGDGENENE